MSGAVAVRATPVYRAGAGIAPAAFLVLSLLLVCTTRNPIVIAAWMGVVAWAAAEGTRNTDAVWLTLVVGVIVFYPDFSYDYSSLTEKVILQAIILMAFFVSAREAVLREASRTPLLSLLAVVWIAWAAASYLPVLATWTLESQVGVPVGAPLRTLYTESSAIKAAAPVVFAPLALFVPMVALRTEDDAAAFYRGLVGCFAVFLALSFGEWIADGHLMAYDANRVLHNERMTGFSVPDPNGLARLMLIPVLLFGARAMSAPRAVGAWMWAVFAAGIVAIALTQSRTTYISMTAGFALLAAFHIRRRGTLRILGVALLGFAAAFYLLGVRHAFSGGSERLSLNSLFLRMDLWRGVLDILGANPWFGAHPGGYMISLRQLGFPEWRIFSPHNFYLYLGAEWGVPMILLGLLLLAAIVTTGLRGRRAAPRRSHAAALGGGCAALAVSYAVHGITETIPPIFVFLVAGLACASVRIAAEGVRD